MGFETLLGNERLKENLTGGIRRGRISHFYLISGPVCSGKRTLARLLGAAMMCNSEEKPCLRCEACRKVMADTHPDFITVTDPEHKAVPVAMVRQYREDMFIRPNEGNRKIYMFPQQLRPEGQNALLKILEEPPKYGVFMLLTENSQEILPTVRSRCVELTMQNLPESLMRQELLRRFPDKDTQAVDAAIARSGGWLGQGISLLEQGVERTGQFREFAKSFATRDTVGLLQVLVPMERWNREALIPELTQWKELLLQALMSRSDFPAMDPAAREIAAQRSSRDLYNAIGCLNKAIDYTQGNISTAAVCGWLEWVLR
jgi:DNA polymerase-3 subunit delta'